MQRRNKRRKINVWERTARKIAFALVACMVCMLAGYGIACLAENMGTLVRPETPQPRKLDGLSWMTCEFRQNDV